jgi:UDP-N-acetylglucosamine 2-epimerase
MIEERDLTGERLAREFRDILTGDERRRQMTRAAARLGAPQAAREIIDVCAELCREKWASPQGQVRAPGFKPVRPPDAPEFKKK